MLHLLAAGALAGVLAFGPGGYTWHQGHHGHRQAHPGFAGQWHGHGSPGHHRHHVRSHFQHRHHPQHFVHPHARYAIVIGSHGAHVRLHLHIGPSLHGGYHPFGHHHHGIVCD